MSEVNSKMFLVRDSEGKVFNQVSDPYAVYTYDPDDGGVFQKMGDKESMEDYYNIMQKAYRDGGFNSMADSVFLMQLPKDQEEIDKVFNMTNYIGKLHVKYMSH